MNELEGIKNFIEDHKKSLEKMHQEMIASYGQVPFIWLTVEEASEVWDSLVNLVSYVESIDGGMSVLVRDGQSSIDLIRNRIKKVEKQDE